MRYRVRWSCWCCCFLPVQTTSAISQKPTVTGANLEGDSSVSTCTVNFTYIMQTVCLHCTVCVQSIVYTQKTTILNKGFIERKTGFFSSLSSFGQPTRFLSLIFQRNNVSRGRMTCKNCPVIRNYTFDFIFSFKGMVHLSVITVILLSCDTGLALHILTASAL